MLFYIAFVAARLINQISLDYSTVPFARSASNGLGISEIKTYKEPAFFIDRTGPVLSPLSPTKIYNLTRCIEKPESILNNSKLYNIESRTSVSTLASLYIKALFKKYHKVTTPLSVNVSCRDYFNEDQRVALSQIFTALGHNTKVIPDTLAACIHHADVEGGEKTHAFLSLRGRQGVLTSYKTKKDGSKITVTKIKESPVEAVADEILEDQAAEYIIRSLREDKHNDTTAEVMKSTAFLPYENGEDAENYIDIRQTVNEFITGVDIGMKELKILEIHIKSKKDDTKTGCLINKVVNIEGFKIDLGIKEIPEVEEGAVKHLISRVERNCGFKKESDQFIVDGLRIAHSPEVVLEDDRVLQRWNTHSVEIFEIERELSMKNVVRELKEDLSKIKAGLERIRSEEFEPLETLLQEENGSLSFAKEVNRVLEGLKSLNGQRIVNEAKRKEQMNAMGRAKEMAEVLLKDETFTGTDRDDLKSYYEETVEWFEKNQESDEGLKEMAKRILMLEARVKMIKRKAEEELKLKAAEELAKEEVNKEPISEEVNKEPISEEVNKEPIDEKPLNKEEGTKKAEEEPAAEEEEKIPETRTDEDYIDFSNFKDEEQIEKIAKRRLKNLESHEIL